MVCVHESKIKNLLFGFYPLIRTIYFTETENEYIFSYNLFTFINEKLSILKKENGGEGEED